MTPGFSDDVLIRLSNFATATLGLRFPPDRWSDLARGVNLAALELGVANLAEWVDLLLAGGAMPAHIRALANHLTIVETYFFRHRETFTLLSDRILPERMKLSRAQARPLRIWSAACSSGEEPYSIAILLRRVFPDLPSAAVAVHGTDINSHVLGRAARGVYSEWSFRDTPAWVKSGNFARKPNGRYEISRDIRRMVTFTQLNFADPFYPPEFGAGADFDLILCRNVLMYFSAEWQQTILRRLVAALATDGWLIVGPCDIAGPQAAELGLKPVTPGIFVRSAIETGAETAGFAGGSNPPALPVPIWPDAGPEFSSEIEWPGATEEAPDLAAGRPDVAGSAGVDAPTATVAQEEVAFALAHARANRGELAEALAACDDALALDKVNPSLHYLRACILQELNRMSEAADAFRRVLFLDPRSAMAQFALGCLAERQGDVAEARRQFALVLQLLAEHNRGDVLPGGEGLTVGRLRALVENNLGHYAA